MFQSDLLFICSIFFLKKVECDIFFKSDKGGLCVYAVIMQYASRTS